MGGGSLVFTYGTLKQGFSNHVLLQDLIRTGDASYVGPFRTSLPFPLVCGPFRVPFLLNLPGRGHRVFGELYSVSPEALARLDDLEGTSRGHYQRLPIAVVRADAEAVEPEEVVEVEAYYAHSSYAEELWKSSGERGYHVYSEKEARGYVRRVDRPPGVTFLDHIRTFVSSKHNDVVAIAASS